ncbi:Rieske 2Fe-2S domain-containing protein [Burkholderia seminalis]|uniref:Rieske 2Fe-2S domain-containing protein n=2 Tax=Burkholderia cepacia complex TaxID=87882 RepID=A0A8A8DFC1_9BURK|nr:Rieske 2Fe-2S domain-containing protein [Burkholderia seminalis]QTO23312.1 Rieske 2Fe-2S domain-containing protein [Burkholderia seminalis]
MLNKESNELLSRVGAGTPMGELFRRFWLPAVLSRELQVDGAPVRLRVLGEDLVAFRESSGAVGIIDAYCAHRGAPLFFGRNEEGGLRCPYHGWKYATDGGCLEVPNVPGADGCQARARAKLTAYRTHEANGVVWIFMGPAQAEPPFPHFDYANAPAGQAYCARWLQRTNWLQGLEGEIDSSHISWLHKDFDLEQSSQQMAGSQTSTDQAPILELRETRSGYTYGARRNHEGRYFWRQSHWVAPMFSFIPHAPGPFASFGGRAWTPIDDNHVTVFTFGFRLDRPFNEAELAQYESGALFPPRMHAGPYALPDGYVIDTFLPVASKENDYEIDRERQKLVNFSGIWGIHDQDRALAENSRKVGLRDPGILDRSCEHLVSSDKAVVSARRSLLALVQELRDGIEPAFLRDAEAFRVRPISKITEIGEFDHFIEAFGAEACVQLTSDTAAK